MTKDEIISTVRDQLSRARRHLDELRLKSHLLKAEVRDRKDVVLADLERRYERVRAGLGEAKEAVGSRASVAIDALQDGWAALREGLARARVPSADEDDDS